MYTCVQCGAVLASARMMAAKRLSYSNGFKLKVAELAIKNGNRSAGREYGVSEKLVRDWRKKKTELAKLP